MARKVRRPRRQRITLRFKRREQLKHHVRNVVVRSVAVALLIGFGAGLVTSSDSFLSRFLQKHTPQVSVVSAQALSNVPVLTELPEQRLLLWLPGSGYWLQKRAVHQFSSVRSVWLERFFAGDRIVVHLEPRVPLVTWNGVGFDRDGVLFAITPGTWKAMPQASFLPTANKPELGRWLAKLAATSEVWSLVSSIKQDSLGTLELTLKTGAVIIWGPPDVEPFVIKTQLLMRVLDDAHKNLGGIVRADLRFFDQGRIIVRPKTAK